MRRRSLNDLNNDPPPPHPLTTNTEPPHHSPHLPQGTPTTPPPKALNPPRVHGLIHLMGFAKGFGYADLPQLTQPISRAWGLAWLAAAVLVTTTPPCWPSALGAIG